MSKSFELSASLSLRELARAVKNERLAPAIRSEARALLAEKIAGLPEIEQAALAKQFDPRLLPIFWRSSSPAVLAALIENPRLREEEIIRICADPAAPPRALEVIAESGRWSCRRPIRLALACSPAAWVADSLRCLNGLLSGDLDRIAHDEGIRRVVRIGAERALARRHLLAPPPGAEVSAV